MKIPTNKERNEHRRSNKRWKKNIAKVHAQSDLNKILSALQMEANGNESAYVDAMILICSCIRKEEFGAAKKDSEEIVN